MQNFFFIDDCPAKDLGGGVTRRILAHDKDLMVCLLHFNKGSIGALHSHPHTQSTFIKSGAFEFEVDGVKKVVRAGIRFTSSPVSSMAVSALRRVSSSTSSHPSATNSWRRDEKGA